MRLIHRGADVDDDNLADDEVVEVHRPRKSAHINIS